ncbi:MAG: DUF559 domain-containing protein [Acidimicrobiales bacterium]
MGYAETEAAMRVVAGRQHWVLTRAQARKAGATRKALRYRLKGVGWEPMSPQVLRLLGSMPTFEQRCMAAVLDSGLGAVASGATAARIWDLPGYRSNRVHVTRPRCASSRETRLGTVHESRHLPAHHCSVHDGIPVTTVARTVFDLAGSVHPHRAARALDNALTRKYVALEELRGVTIELLARGRTGSALMRELLGAREAGYIPPASGLEASFLALLVAAGIDLPQCQVDLGDDGWVGRVDFYYRWLRLVIEIDSEVHHSSKLDVEADEQRDRALRAAGFEVMRVREAELRDRPEDVVARVRAALGEISTRSGPQSAA